MKIAVLRVSVQGEEKNSSGYYNAQFLGVSKELDNQCDEVIVYEHILKGQPESVEAIAGCRHATLHRIAVNNIGVNGIVNLSKLDTSIDALVLFSDIQLSVPKIFRWAKRNDIVLIPYIGVLESHSNYLINKLLMNIAIHRNLKVYRRCHCLAKTPPIMQRLKNAGVQAVSLMPAGLDLSLLKEDYSESSRSECAKQFAFSSDDKLILFVGRLTEEKQPLRMVDIFHKIYRTDQSFRLCMVGDGEMKTQVVEKVSELGLSKCVRLIESVPNPEMWKLFRIADCFVNLNQQEIFGMAILEAMYYECRVIALHAPGPDFIIEDKISGALCDTDSDIIREVLGNISYSAQAKERVMNHFTWRTTSKAVMEVIQIQNKGGNI